MKHRIAIIGALAVAAMVPAGSARAGLSLVNEDCSRNWQPNMSSVAMHQSISFDQKFSGLAGMTLSMLRDTRTSMNYSGQRITSITRQLHMQTDPKNRSILSFDRTSSDSGAGVVRELEKLAFSSRPTDKLSLNMAMTSQSYNGSAQTGRSFGAAWAVSKGLSLSMNTTSAVYGRGGRSNNTVYLLQGSLPKALGIAKNLKFNINKTLGMDTATAIGFTSHLLGGDLTVESADRGWVGWNGPYRSFLDFATGFGPGKKVKLDLVTKERTAETGVAAVVQRGTISSPVGKKSSATAALYVNRDTPWQTVERVKGAEFAASTVLHRWSVSASYRGDADIISRVRHTIYALNASATAKDGGSVQAGCSMDNWAGHTTWVYSLKYDRQVSAEQFVTLTSELRTSSWAGQGTRKSTQIWLDLRRRVH